MSNWTKPSDLDLWFFPLIDVGFCDFKVDSLDSAGFAQNLDATQIILKVVQKAGSVLYETIQSVIIGKEGLIDC